MVEQPEGCHLLIVDALNLAFRYEHKGVLEFVEDYIATVKSFKKSFKCSKVLIAYDIGSSSFRRGIYPQYKAGRKEKFNSKTDAEKVQSEKFFEEFARTIEELKKMPEFLVIGYPKVEADDLAAYVVRNMKTFGIDTIKLLSSDRDWDLLLNDSVSRFSYVTRKDFTVDNWHEHYEYPVNHHLSVKCLMGDSGDSIPGVDKVGPKRAASLSEEYSGDICELAANLPLQGNYVYIKNLNTFGKDNLMLNLKLMDLLEFCEEAIGEDNIKDFINNLEKHLAI